MSSSRRTLFSPSSHVRSVASVEAGRTTSAGHALWRTTEVATLPRAARARPVRPCVASATSAGSRSSASADRAGGRVAADHARLDINVGREFFDRGAHDQFGRGRRLDIERMEDVHEHDAGADASAHSRAIGTMAFDAIEPSTATSKGPSKCCWGEQAGPTCTAGTSSSRTTSSATLSKRA
jgi:hypothetical protein